jgi:hypothetical protein
MIHVQYRERLRMMLNGTRVTVEKLPTCPGSGAQRKILNRRALERVDLPPKYGVWIETVLTPIPCRQLPRSWR